MIERLPSTTAAKAEWDAFVRTSSAGSVFATSLFLDALGVSYDLWVTRKDAAIDAALPLVRGLCGLSTNPLYCKYLGLLPPPTDSLKPSTAASDFYGRVEAFAALLKATRSFDYTFHPAITNWMPFHWLGFRQQTHFTYVIPHTAKDTWWEEADSRLRRSVRRGKKADVIIRPGDVDSPADIAACYELSMLPFTSRGSPPVINRPRFRASRQDPWQVESRPDLACRSAACWNHLGGACPVRLECRIFCVQRHSNHGADGNQFGAARPCH